MGDGTEYTLANGEPCSSRCVYVYVFLCASILCARWKDRSVDKSKDGLNYQKLTKFSAWMDGCLDGWMGLSPSRDL